MFYRSAELSELIGIVLGDGSIYKGKKHQYQLDIAFNSRDISYIEYVRNLIQNFVNVPIYRKVTEKQHCIHLRICNRNAVEDFIKSSNITFGDKIANQCRISSWIWTKSEYIGPCLRGLIDTDGSLYRLRPHWPNLFQLSFKNRNMSLLKDVRNAFVILGFSPSKIFVDRVVLTRQAEIKRYLKTVGTNNPKRDSPVV